MLKIFKNMKISTRLIIGYIIVAIFAAIPGVIANSLMNTINTANDEAMAQYGFSQGDIGKAMYIVADYNKQVRDVISFNDTAAMKKALKKMEEDVEAYNGYVETVKLTLITESEIAQLDIIESAFSAYITKAGEIVEMGNTIDTKIKHRAQSQAISELDPLYSDLNDAWQTLMDIKVEDGNARGDEITAQTKTSQLMCLVLTVATLAFSIFSGIFVARTVSKPINSCVKRLEKLSTGDLSSPVETTGTKDETGILLNALDETTTSFKLIIDDLSFILDQLAKGDLTADTEKEGLYIGDYAPLLESLRKTVHSQNSALRTIYRSSDQVSLGSAQVSGGAQSLSEGTAAQANSVEVLSDAIKSLMDDVERNAEDARAAGELAVQTSAQMDMSNTQMTHMVAAMNDISDSSIKISQIMRTIEDIAFQTNILALNAAVEAARAGDAGKGFAVVADEVRNLAEKSAEASGNTAELIENSLKAVENGTKIASDTAKALSIADESARRVAETIERISQASARQAEGLHKVTDGIENISGVIQTNSATAQESAAASEQLSGQAGMLKSLVEKFKLK